MLDCLKKSNYFKSAVNSDQTEFNEPLLYLKYAKKFVKNSLEILRGLHKFNSSQIIVLTNSSFWLL